MSNRVGIGVVGAGAIGIRGALMHLSLDDVQDRLRLAAVCDPVPGRAQAAAQKYGVDAHYLTYEEMLADPNVDAVTLCSPIGLHFRQGMMAIDAGKHIHFNKTMTTTVDEADRLMAAAAEKGIKIVASPGMMLHPYNRRIRRAILEGKLGALAWAIGGTSAGSGTYHLNEEFRTGDDILTTVDP
ncbi:MAG: Gfo/Idh/MocA family oxidoreductase, partial [Anaerolineae bacterium]|nr:Gfo/Idh/MocA family oxidoreductase [Anaerolineae bacterium]